MLERMKKLKSNNSGVALVMVIVVIGFVSIIATVMLYMSAMNFYMKTTDAKIKNGFYSGEKAMEQIRSMLMLESEKAFEAAYNDVLPKYGVSDANTMQALFNKAFTERFVEQWNKDTTPSGTSYPSSAELKNYLKELVDDEYADSIDATAGCVGGLTTHADNSTGIITISKVEIKYTDDNHYTTWISTDFVIKAPDIDFSKSSTEDTPIVMADCVTYSNWVKK